MKAKVKYPVLGLKKGEIVEIQKDFDSYCLIFHDNSLIRVDKKNLELQKK
jgi:hypothetical protein